MYPAGAPMACHRPESMTADPNGHVFGGSSERVEGPRVIPDPVRTAHSLGLSGIP